VNDATREALRELLGSNVVEVHDLRYESTARKVWRVRTAGHPECVIVKEAVAGTDHVDDAWTYIRRDGECLQDAAASGVVPQVLALDEDHRVLVMEDLGTGPSLADLLLGEDAEAAAAALVEYARSLGKLHRATRSDAGFADEGVHLAGDVVTAIERLSTGLASIDITIDDDALDDVGTVALEIADPGPLLAVAHGDPCPDNTSILADGSVALFDFEWGSRASAMLDVAYLHLPFPSCWCANEIPAGVVAEAERAYRDEFDCTDSYFASGLAAAAVAWCVTTISWDVDRFTGDDVAWGIAGRRPRYLTRLHTTRALCERAGRFGAFRAFTERLEDAFAARWPDAAAGLPPYPAFR
jgi:hypothetical protein